MLIIDYFFTGVFLVFMEELTCFFPVTNSFVLFGYGCFEFSLEWERGLTSNLTDSGYGFDGLTDSPDCEHRDVKSSLAQVFFVLLF